MVFAELQASQLHAPNHLAVLRMLAMLLLFCACDALAPLDQTPAGALPDLTTEQQARAEALISFFEHSTLDKQYDATYALGDGRGYTVGWIGFTTSSGSAAEVVRRYVQTRHLAPIGRYLAELDRLKQGFQGDVSGLDGFPEAWKQAAADPEFRAAQDAVARDWYYAPAQRYAQAHGVRSALGLALLYDTAIQHGDGYDADGLQAILKRAGAAPSDGASEADWLNRFVDARRQTLLEPANRTTRDTWRESVWRAEVWQQIVDSGAYDLGAGVRISGHWFDFRLP
jgi:chitosanase